MGGAKDPVPRPGEVAVVHHRQGPAVVGAGIDPAPHVVALAHQEGREQGVSRPEAEAAGAGVGARLVRG